MMKMFLKSQALHCIRKCCLLSIIWHTLSLDEIFWEDRLNPYNHTPDFPFYVTGIVDTVPFTVLQPIDPTLNHAIYNPKYGHTVYKAQVGIDFLGRIVLFSGPHLGLQYDGRISFSNFILFNLIIL